MRFCKNDIKFECISEDLLPELIDYAESFAINFGSVRIKYDYKLDIYRLYVPKDKAAENFESLRELQAYMKGVLSGIHGRFNRLPINKRQSQYVKHQGYRKERAKEA